MNRVRTTPDFFVIVQQDLLETVAHQRYAVNTNILWFKFLQLYSVNVRPPEQLLAERSSVSSLQIVEIEVFFTSFQTQSMMMSSNFRYWHCTDVCFPGKASLSNFGQIPRIVLSYIWCFRLQFLFHPLLRSPSCSTGREPNYVLFV